MELLGSVAQLEDVDHYGAGLKVLHPDGLQCSLCFMISPDRKEYTAAASFY